MQAAENLGNSAADPQPFFDWQKGISWFFGEYY
jgi:hypothetical protein